MTLFFLIAIIYISLLLPVCPFRPQVVVNSTTLNHSNYEKFSEERLRLYELRNEHNTKLSDRSRVLASSTGPAHGHTAHNRHVNKPWSSLPSVDGLRNDEVAMFVTSTAFQESYFLRAR